MASAGRVHFLLLRGDDTPPPMLISALAQVGEVEILDAAEAADRLARGPTPVHPIVIPPEAWRRLPGLARASSDLERALDAVGRSIARLGPEGELEWGSTSYRALAESVRRRIEEEARKLLGPLRESVPAPETSLPPVRRIIGGEEPQRLFEAAFVPMLGPRSPGDETAARVVAVIALLRDISSEIESERRLDAIDRAGRELLRLDPDEIRRLEAPERLRILQERIARAAHDLLHFDHFTIRLIEPATGRLEPVIAVGVPQDVLDVELYSHREGSGISGYVAATGRSVNCRNTAADERYIRGLEKPGSSITVPLLINDRVIGVLNVESDRRSAFSDDDLRFTEIFARYIALSLHILDLLVIERSATNERVSGRVEGEIGEPLDDLERQAAWLRDHADAGGAAANHVDRILRDIHAIRRRMQSVARGPRSLLGADLDLQEIKSDPQIADRSILVVDDEELIRAQIADVLTRRGGQVTIADSGGQAIALLRGEERVNGERARFDLVISDIRLPDRNGYEVFAAARAAKADMPVILMTGFGYDPHHSVMRASQEGLQAVLFKPFHVARLVEVVRQVLAGCPSAAGAERPRRPKKRASGGASTPEA